MKIKEYEDLYNDSYINLVECILIKPECIHMDTGKFTSSDSF